MKKSKVIIFFIPMFIVMLLVFGIILFPNESILAAKEGFGIWSNILVPSLLPFIIGANLIVDLKVIDIIGLIINPITRIIFNVSGKSALVFAISTVSGYPIGAKLASQLRETNEISKYEAQRLVSFCSTSGPLFIIGSVSVGMFGSSSLGYLMIVCHYLGSILVGLLFRNYGNETLPRSNYKLKDSLANVIDSRYSNNNGFFILFGNAVFNGVNTLLNVGGFVIVFFVVFKVLSIFNIISIISNVVYLPLSIFGVPKELCQSFISGLFEITLGCSKVSSVSYVSEAFRACLCSFLIGFSGLSILAQCCSFLAKTDINLNIYIFSKFLHGIFASMFTFLFYPLLKSSVVVSNFNIGYDNLFNNFIWNFYISNYNIIASMIIIIYIISSIFIAKKKFTVI